MISNSYRLFSSLLIGVFLSLASTASSYAACGFDNKQPVTFDFPNYSFYKIIGAAIEECGNVSGTYTGDSESIGFSKKSSTQKTSNLIGASVATLGALEERKLLRPLDDLVSKYGAGLHKRQLIRRNGQIVAVAVAGNAQVLVFHEGILKQAGIEPPKSYSNLVDVAQKLANSAIVKKPFSLALKDGWSVANEFANFIMSDGGELLNKANQANFNNAKGEAALNQMVALLSFIPDNFDKADDKGVQSHLARGEVAMASLWASSAVQLDNPALSRVSGRTKLAPLPSINTGGKPASSLWWDGFAISASSSEAEADAAFKIAMEGLDIEMVTANQDAAIWLMKDYIPNSFTQSVIDSIELGIPEYPATVATEMLYKVLGTEIPKFLKGEKGATQTLIDAEAAYSAAARERGLIN